MREVQRATVLWPELEDEEQTCKPPGWGGGEWVGVWLGGEVVLPSTRAALRSLRSTGLKPMHKTLPR